MACCGMLWHVMAGMANGKSFAKLSHLAMLLLRNLVGKYRRRYLLVEAGSRLLTEDIMPATASVSVTVRKDLRKKQKNISKIKTISVKRIQGIKPLSLLVLFDKRCMSACSEACVYMKASSEFHTVQKLMGDGSTLWVLCPKKKCYRNARTHLVASSRFCLRMLHMFHDILMFFMAFLWFFS